MEQKDIFKELILKVQRAVKELPIERTPDCPSDKTLYSLCYEEKGSSLSDHIVTCKYCATFVRIAIQYKNKVSSLSDFVHKDFPLPEEIDFDNIKIITLYKDNSKISQVDVSPMNFESIFDINLSGLYHLEIDTGQVIWMREINEQDIQLSDEEQEKVREYGMAAKSDNKDNSIIGFQETRWDGCLEVKLEKRVSNSRLIFKFTNYKQ